MTIGRFCNREVVIVDREARVSEAAQLMRQHHVGSVVIVEAANGGRRPVGIVTDRDIVIELAANGLDAETVLVTEIAAGELVAVREEESLFDTLRLMRDRGVRRVPVVDGNGFIQGVAAADDLLSLMAEEMGLLARLVSHEREREREARR